MEINETVPSAVLRDRQHGCREDVKSLTLTFGCGLKHPIEVCGDETQCPEAIARKSQQSSMRICCAFQSEVWFEGA